MIKNKKGFTIIEALMAITILTLIVTAIFAVLTSSMRSVKQPTIREDSILAVEKASNLLKIYVDKDVYGTSSYAEVPSAYQNGLCHDDGITDTDPMGIGSHNIFCLLPDICRDEDSTFTYTVSTTSVSSIEYKNIDFDLTCGV